MAKLKYGKCQQLLLLGIIQNLALLLFLSLSLSEFTPVIIDNSNPIENDPATVTIDDTRKKMFRDRSPTEHYFDKLVTGGQCKSELDDIYKKQDMIK